MDIHFNIDMQAVAAFAALAGAILSAMSGQLLWPSSHDLTRTSNKIVWAAILGAVSAMLFIIIAIIVVSFWPRS